MDHPENVGVRFLVNLSENGRQAGAGFSLLAALNREISKLGKPFSPTLYFSHSHMRDPRYSTRPTAGSGSPSTQPFSADRVEMGSTPAEDKFRWAEIGGAQPVAQPLMYVGHMSYV